ncbi:hypothetical protein [Lacicoccus qingdaonensis]|uniref:Uncharacterized protein n=1 Tax=Lacicoccus qingdaonensis TaxID=576118 RepID=A0A1G9IMF0_9BACL|nr:hypothetical protein [Salinicoccus qingdaonensis]SDL26255.1 hypothetical protein SAMN05216216_13512 [Salinicoccus qingdaonensis]
MILALILLIIAIGYAYKRREEPMAMATAGSSLLAVGIIALLIFALVAADILHFGESSEDIIVLVAMGDALILIPAGLILMITGLVLNRKKSK